MNGRKCRRAAFGLALALALVLTSGYAVRAASTGELKLEVLGALGAGAQNRAQVFDAAGRQVAQVAPGGAVALAPGVYSLALPIVGGKLSRDDVSIEAGHLHTVMIDNVAVLAVRAKNRDGTDPGLGVTVTASDSAQTKLAVFSTGEKMLFAPAMVDVSVDAPPQGENWHAVVLRPGHLTRLTLNQMVPGHLVVQPILARMPVDRSTQVVIYAAGTQRQIATSPPGNEHRLELDPGKYDVYVENRSGKGIPYAMVKGVKVAAGATTEQLVPLDGK